MTNTFNNIIQVAHGQMMDNGSFKICLQSYTNIPILTHRSVECFKDIREQHKSHKNYPVISLQRYKKIPHADENSNGLMYIKLLQQTKTSYGRQQPITATRFKHVNAFVLKQEGENMLGALYLTCQYVACCCLNRFHDVNQSDIVICLS